MNTKALEELDAEQMIDLKELVEVLMSAVEMSKDRPGREGAESFWRVHVGSIGRMRYNLGEVGRSAFWFIEAILKGSTELSGTITRDNAEYLLNALASVLVSPDEAYYLTALMTKVGVDQTWVPAIIKAGEALAQMREIDPELGVAGPGIESYYTRHFWDGAYDGREAVGEVMHVLAKALG